MASKNLLYLKILQSEMLKLEPLKVPSLGGAWYFS